MDAAVLVGAAVLGVLISPVLLRMVVRVPALVPAGYVSEEEATISPAFRERAVRITTPVLFALAAGRFGADAVLVPFLVLFAVLVVVSVIDLEHYRIPDRIVFPALGVSLGLIVFVTLMKGLDSNIDIDVSAHIRNALIGAVAYFVLLLVPHLVYPRGMGFEVEDRDPFAEVVANDLGVEPAPFLGGGNDAAEVARQLSNLSPAAACAVAAAAKATTDEEREAALAAVSQEGEEPIDRELLLRFLASVKS
jgi:hypothetical protein